MWIGYSSAMSNLPPSIETEPKQVDDNARKFIVEPIESDLIAPDRSKVQDMTFHWTDTRADFESKVVEKLYVYEDKEPEIRQIAKKTDEQGKRKSTPEDIARGTFLQVCADFPDMPHLEKRRTEFFVLQNGISYRLKYDEFTGYNFYMVEVDTNPAADMTDQDLSDFDPSDFFVSIAEVTGEPAYTGYRIVETLKRYGDKA